MSSRNYADRLADAIREKQTPALVGLDPRLSSLPRHLRETAGNAANRWSGIADAYREFCLRVLDIVAPLVPAVKPQVAFFEECGPAGMQALDTVIRTARAKGLIVIADAKRGDIGSTAEGYAQAWLAGEDPDAAAWAADALTINPYLGADTLQPFIDVAVERKAGLYVLARTSNPGAGFIQDRAGDDTHTIYQHVAQHIESVSRTTATSGSYGCVGAVVGATYPEELRQLRQLMPSVPLLVPGYGSQGGTSADVAAAFDSDGQGALINSSRGIIFACQRKDLQDRFTEDRWEDAIDFATRAMIDDLRQHTAAARLVAG